MRCVEFERFVVYLAPSGRACRWHPNPNVPPGGAVVATFIYDLIDGQPAPASAEGFTLTRENWHLMVKAA